MDLMNSLGVLGAYYTVINILANHSDNVDITALTVLLIAVPIIVGFAIYFIKDYMLSFNNQDEVYYIRMRDALIKILGECKK